MTRYVVWPPGYENLAHLVVAETSFQARKVVAEQFRGLLEVTDLCGMRESHIGFIAHAKRQAILRAIADQ